MGYPQEAPKRRMTETEYLEFEAHAMEKHEFYDGEVIALAGVRRNHGVVVSNLIYELRSHGSDDCITFASDMRVYLPRDNSYFYPDVVGVCGEERYSDDTRNQLENPNLIVEVMSPSTAARDRGRKFSAYRSVPSVQEIVFVEPEYRSVEVHRREEGRWVLVEPDADGTLTLTSVGATLDVDAIYARVTLSEPPAPYFTPRGEPSGESYA